ncbi:CU044_5270 family protein [Actinomadura madurae]|uniref:CU044_5270 family protein n=1 Tax=Actinomadura madurae TaxID=1993 RepID=A0A1I5LVX8_9ACTN|nr:CU044_5270 family protein [Actinomadura madurae]SFP00926.1 hypothetical protein SAMN04489713_11129 [Actinomadura madurae]SPT52205.1 Uncharacterised protein [Actinomadura madurae]
MNEKEKNVMDQVRALLQEPPPPSQEVTAKALAMLEDAMAPGGGHVRTSRPRRRFGWPVKLGAGLVAVGAAAAVAIALTGQGSPGSPGSPGTPGTVDLNRKAVLAAAAKAELAPTGKYWHTDSIDGQSYIVRAKTGTYAIVGAASESFHWAGVKKGTGEAYYDRDLPARPLTPQDEAAWKRAGSPSSFRVWSNDHYYTYKAKATPWRSNGPEVGVFPEGGGEFLGKSIEEWQNLPADPARLTDILLGNGEARFGADPSGGKRNPRLKAEAAQASDIWRTASILSNTPVTPKVRAALMRALAARPGVQAIGTVADPLGRRGVALASGERTATIDGEWGGPKAERGTYRHRQVIVFDPRTGGLLAVQDTLTQPGGRYSEMKPGFIINYVATRSEGWTDTKPKPPAELPF